MVMAAKPSLIGSMLTMKCPNCRKGNMFINRSIFPLKQLLKMPERCAHCGQKMELEVGFYYGTGYVSYGLCAALSVFNLVWFWLIFGITWRDNSMFWYLGVNVVVLLFLQPWIMRMSRVLYLYMFVRYGKGAVMSDDRFQ